MKSRIGSLLITASIVCSLVFDVSPAQSGTRAMAGKMQTETIRGYYCGQQSGNRAGEFYFRVGRQVRSFSINLGQQGGGNAKASGFKIANIKLGNEYVVNYRAGSGDFIDSIRFTGRSKKTAPCPAG